MDGFNLERFVEAQAPVYPQALAELRRGRKESHWMWFVFPQIAGLGRSMMAQRYAIASLAEAEAYLGHSLLGTRLIECTSVVLAHAATRIDRIFGSIDSVKLRSSMTLFAEVPGAAECFERCMELFFDGEKDRATLALLQRQD